MARRVTCGRATKTCGRDLRSLGVVLYELATLHAPFSEDRPDLSAQDVKACRCLLHLAALCDFLKVFEESSCRIGNSGSSIAFVTKSRRHCPFLEPQCFTRPRLQGSKNRVPGGHRGAFAEAAEVLEKAETH